MCCGCGEPLKRKPSRHQGVLKCYLPCLQQLSFLFSWNSLNHARGTQIFSEKNRLYLKLLQAQQTAATEGGRITHHLRCGVFYENTSNRTLAILLNVKITLFIQVPYHCLKKLRVIFSHPFSRKMQQQADNEKWVNAQHNGNGNAHCKI